MILPLEKAKDHLDTTDDESRDTEAPRVLSSSSPIGSSSRAIAPPTFPIPEDAPPPLYSDTFAGPSTSSYYASTSSATEYAASVPTAPFSRVPSREVMYPSFPPMFLVATGKSLDKGFPYASPPSSSNPHPFVSHDVNEGDWTSFLEEVKSAAALTDKQVRRSHLPIVCIVPIVNELSSYGVKQIMKRLNISKVIICIDKWNRHFFELRKIRIVLTKGQVTVKGQTEYPNNATFPSSSHNPEFGDRKHEDHPSTSSAVGIVQELIDKNDDIYRLFLFPLP